MTYDDYFNGFLISYALISVWNFPHIYNLKKSKSVLVKDSIIKKVVAKFITLSFER
jgi:hypothetical protein